MIIIEIDKHDKQTQNAAMASPQKSSTSAPPVGKPNTDAIIMNDTSRMPQNPSPTDWRCAGDACDAKRAAGGGCYQGDVHHNGTTSPSAVSNDYACGRNLGKW